MCRAFPGRFRLEQSRNCECYTGERSSFPMWRRSKRSTLRFCLMCGEWPLQQDRSASGRPLRLKGREFPKGLGMHSRTTVTYDLAEKFRVFQAVVGLDDTTIGDGTAKCAVDVDGRRVFEPPALTRLQGPVRLPNIDVSGAKRLTLTVDFGELGDSQDQVNWGDAVLLR